MQNKFERVFIRFLQEIKYKIGRIKILNYKKDWINLVPLIESENCRLPKSTTKGLSRGIRVNNLFLAGRKIDFIIDEDTLEIKILYRNRRILKHMCITGTSGIDVFVLDGDILTWKKCISPENDFQMYVQDCIHFNTNEKTLRLYMPPFCRIEAILVKKSKFKLRDRKSERKIVVYGSSISQGCAASRPSLSYTNLLSILTQSDVLNFGFSESAKGEETVIKYIANLDANLIILEYDHNSSLEELKMTHKNAYRTIRSVSDCWLIFMTRFSGGISITLEEDDERIKIVTETYEYALKSGDNRVSLINGSLLFGKDKSFYLADGVHPNDLGMKMIGQKIHEIILERGMLK